MAMFGFFGFEVEGSSCLLNRYAYPEATPYPFDQQVHDRVETVKRDVDEQHATVRPHGFVPLAQQQHSEHRVAHNGKHEGDALAVMSQRAKVREEAIADDECSIA